MYLEKLEDGISIKQFNIEELNFLASEIRSLIIDTVNNNGGHLSPNLGTVELIIALFYVKNNFIIRKIENVKKRHSGFHCA